MSLDLEQFIRDVPDFPKPGIVFKDITPLLRNPAALHTAVEQLVAPYVEAPPDAFVAVEARGFIFAAAAAIRLGCGVVPVRKPGKLPAATLQVEYELEYGNDALEIHQDALDPGDRVVIMDDLLATGGTTAAAVKLLRELGTEVISSAFLIELEFLNGRERIADHPVHSLIRVA